MSAIVAVKNEKREARFKSSLGPSSPISEITTSHVCRLKRQETQLFKKPSVFLIKRVKTYMLYIFWVSNG